VGSSAAGYSSLMTMNEVTASSLNGIVAARFLVAQRIAIVSVRRSADLCALVAR
jgi:hypothetical protein